MLARCGEIEPAAPWPDNHKGGRSKGPEWDTEKAHTLYGEGRNDAEIARALGLVPSTIAKWRRSEGLPSVRSLKKRRALEAMKSETASAPEPLAPRPQLLPLSEQAGPVELSIDVQGCALSLRAPDLEGAAWIHAYAGRLLEDMRQIAMKLKEGPGNA